MSEEQPGTGAGGGDSSVATAVVQERSGISIVWLIPVVAVVIGAWLAYKAISEQGPEVGITFETAAGLEAGKTKIKYKDVEVGRVESILLAEDISRVEVRASMVAGAENYLTENTRFWVVRARVSAGQVSGLGTIFSGAYIAIDPSQEGEPQREFVGLEDPPAFTSDEPGTVFRLQASSMGSLDVGSPVYFRWLSVGEVVDYELDPSGDHVAIQIFVRAPHDQRVRANTTFWNASGFDAAMTTEGFRIDSPSLTAMLIGGIAFDTPGDPSAASPVAEDTVFPLYANRAATNRPVLTVREPFLLHFDQPAGGLHAGSPVTFRGIQIGEVRDVSLIFDEEAVLPRIPVLIEVQPDRIQSRGVQTTTVEESWNFMVSQGLRAQLKTQNFLTGALAVELDFHPKAPPAAIDWSGSTPEFPTLPSGIDAIMEGVASFVAKLDDVPLDRVGEDASALLRELRSATPALTATLENAEQTLASANALLAPDSEASQELTRALRELGDAAHSMRLLADQLEQQPESVIRGRQALR